jgi:FAD/FMN-containing dehydrogenase
MSSQTTRLDRDDPRFDDHLVERLFNKLPHGRRPDVVAVPQTEGDVVQLVRDARRDGQRIAVVSGGHSWIGAPVRDGGLLVDLAAFDSIEVDAAARAATIGPAARSGMLARTLAESGFAYPSGHCGTPGFGGYVLGGGIGLNSGHWKPACYSLRSIRAVTAEGDLVVASETRNRDLLWLARGAGPAFPGIVTQFEIDLQDRPAETRVSTWVCDLGDLAAVSRWVGEVSASLPSYVEVFTATAGPGRGEFVPAEGYPDHVVMVSATAYARDADEAREALAPLAAGPAAPVLAHLDQELVAFEDLHAAFDAEYPEDHRYLADAFWTDLDVEGVMVPLRETFERAPSDKSNYVALMPGNGSRLGLSPDDAAYSMDERTLVMHYAVWDDPAQDEANRAWHAEMAAILEPLSVGNFVSEADHESHPGRLERSFSPHNWKRVQELRAVWDPDGVFHHPGRA